MKIIPLIISLLFLNISAYGAEKNSYTVKSIEDGDTIVVDFQGKSQRIQLSGIDAPENSVNAKLNLDIKVKNLSKKALFEIGDIASDYLKTQVAAGQQVELQGDLSKPDRYGRIPAVVFNEKGDSLNKRMVEAGYAIILTRYPLPEDLESTLKKAQQHAITNQQGLWKTHNKVTTIWSARKKP